MAPSDNDARLHHSGRESAQNWPRLEMMVIKEALRRTVSPELAPRIKAVRLHPLWQTHWKHQWKLCISVHYCVDLQEESTELGKVNLKSQRPSLESHVFPIRLCTESDV